MKKRSARHAARPLPVAAAGEGVKQLAGCGARPSSSGGEVRAGTRGLDCPQHGRGGGSKAVPDVA